jgi:hypothetical protein
VRQARLWQIYVDEMRALGAGNANASADMLRKAYADALAAELARRRNRRQAQPQPPG